MREWSPAFLQIAAWAVTVLIAAVGRTIVEVGKAILYAAAGLLRCRTG